MTVPTQVLHNEQMGSDVSAPWTNWHALSHPSNMAKLLALAAHPDGRVHAVMAVLDDQIWHNVPNHKLIARLTHGGWG